MLWFTSSFIHLVSILFISIKLAVVILFRRGLPITTICTLVGYLKLALFYVWFLLQLGLNGFYLRNLLVSAWYFWPMSRHLRLLKVWTLFAWFELRKAVSSTVIILCLTFAYFWFFLKLLTLIRLSNLLGIIVALLNWDVKILIECTQLAILVQNFYIRVGFFVLQLNFLDCLIFRFKWWWWWW